MKEVRTEIDIAAPAERVWAILTGFDEFSLWNPFMRRASGKIRVGEWLDITLQPSGTRGMRIKPQLLIVDPNRELRWIGRLILPGIFDGEHSFTIEPVDPQTVRLVQKEEFSGFLVPLGAKGLDGDTRRGFEEMNRALKTRAERQNVM